MHGVGTQLTCCCPWANLLDASTSTLYSVSLKFRMHLLLRSAASCAATYTRWEGTGKGMAELAAGTPV